MARLQEWELNNLIPTSKRNRSKLRSNSQKFIRNSNAPKLSVVIPVSNERKTILRVLKEVSQLHPQMEVIVVANGSQDGTRELALRAGARVISYEHCLGHDVGRSIGANYAKGDIILFTDGDIVLPASSYLPLIRAVSSGVDVALNSYSGVVNKVDVHSVVLAKYTLNNILGRSDLKGASMTTIPHALSSRALKVIGPSNLSVPPKAHAMAIHSGLKVETSGFINVGSLNPIRRKRFVKMKDPLENLILGDHLEAIYWLTEQTNERANLTDFTRKRQMLR